MEIVQLVESFNTTKKYTYSSVARNALVGKVEEVFVVHAIPENLGQRDSLSDVVHTVCIREDTKRDSIVIGCTVRTKVVLLSVFVFKGGTLKELVQVGQLVSIVLVTVLILAPLVHLVVLRLVQLGTVSVVVLADVGVTWKVVLVD
jgi:hypothetical protein